MTRVNKIIFKRNYGEGLINTVDKCVNTVKSVGYYKDTIISTTKELGVFSLGALVIYGLGKLLNTTDLSIGVTVGICASAHVSTYILQKSVNIQKNIIIDQTNKKLDAIEKSVEADLSEVKSDVSNININMQNEIHHIQNQNNLDLILGKIKLMENDNLNTRIMSYLNKDLSNMTDNVLSTVPGSCPSKEKLLKDWYLYLKKSKVNLENENTDYSEKVIKIILLHSNQQVKFKDDIYVYMKLKDDYNVESDSDIKNNDLIDEDFLQRVNNLKDDNYGFDDNDMVEENFIIKKNDMNLSLLYNLQVQFFITYINSKFYSGTEENFLHFKSMLSQGINEFIEMQSNGYKIVKLPLSYFIYIVISKGLTVLNYKFEPMSDDLIDRYFMVNNDINIDNDYNDIDNDDWSINEIINETS